jgi:hypothetical protein
VADVMALPPGLSETPLAIGVYNVRGQDAATLKVVVLLESVTGARRSAEGRSRSNSRRAAASRRSRRMER